MVVETKKILDPKIKVTATCVRVPVFVGHSESVNVEFDKELSAEQAQDILREAPGVMLVDKREAGGYVTPVECAGDYATFVSRVRDDSTVRSEEHTSELQSLMRNSYAVSCSKQTTTKPTSLNQTTDSIATPHKST